MESILYPDYTDELKNVEKRIRITEEKSEETNEYKELLGIADAFTKTDKKTLSPYASYDINLNIKALGQTAIIKQPEKTKDIEPFVKKAEGAVVQAAEMANFEQANSEIFSYYGWMSDLKISSQTMVDIANELNTNLKGPEQSKSILDIIGQPFDDLKKRLEKVINSTGKFFSEAGKTFKEKLSEAGEWLKKNVVSKFIEAFKRLSEAFDAFRLKLFESMFDFVRKVINLAAEKDWKIQSITVGMPEIGFDSTEINSVKIPIPSIKEPPVTFQFKPKEQAS